MITDLTRSIVAFAVALLAWTCTTHSISPAANASSADSGGTVAEEAETAAARPRLEVNHLYVALEEEDYQAVLESEFLREEFSVLQELTQTSDSAGTWTAVYLMGRKAYLELLGSNGPEGVEVGFAGLGLSSQTLGQLDVVYGRLREVHGEAVSRYLESIPGEGNDVPLYWTVTMAGDEDWPTFNCWMMEDHEDRPVDYLGVERDAAGFAPRGRQMVAAVGFMSPTASLAEVLFDDVTGIEVTASSSDAEALELMLVAAGFDHTSGDDIERFVGSRCKIVVRKSDQPRYGITSIRFSLSRHVDHEVRLELGESLEFTIASGSDQAELCIGGK